MIAIAAKTEPYTPEAYLALELEAEIRNEYRNGEIVPMTGGTPNHNALASNLLVALKLALKGQPYRVFITDQRLWIPERNLYTYPDIMVVSHPLALQSGRKDTVTQPLFIAEVLSDSTKHYDRDEKFAAYRTLPSFREYLLIDQYRIHVEHYLWQAKDRWRLMEYDCLEGRVLLSSLEVAIALAALYETVEMPADETRPQ